jgi:hypothetical protein
MHSFHHSRGRIFFEVLCAFGIAASCVWAWMQTYATAMLPMAGIAGLYGLIHFFDMFRRRPAAAEPVAVVEPVIVQRDTSVAASEPAPVNEAPQFVEPPVEPVAEAAPKRKRKSSRSAPKVAPPAPEPEPEAVEVVALAEPEVVELQPAMRIVDSAPDESDYVPATPLFEPEPFVRQQRAAFGRKAR